MSTAEHPIAREEATLLERAMLGNAAVSGASGMVLIAGAALLDTWLGVDARALALLGASLVAYAVDLLLFTRSERGIRVGGRIAVGADAAWVVGAAGLIVFTDLLTAEGEAVLAVVTVVVAALGLVQAVGLSRPGAESG